MRSIISVRKLEADAAADVGERGGLMSARVYLVREKAVGKLGAP